jgi:hypothetical protein
MTVILLLLKLGIIGNLITINIGKNTNHTYVDIVLVNIVLTLLP